MITNLNINSITNMINNIHAISCCRYQVTDIHISDNSTEFVNLVAQDLYNCSGVQHHVTLPYHPQANGLVEILNRTTTDRLKTMIKKQSDWVDALQTVAWIHPSTCHSSTNYESLRFILGRKPKLPSQCKKVDTDITQIQDLTQDEVDNILEMAKLENIEILMEMRENVFDDAAGNIWQAQKRQKRNYDIQHKDRGEFLQIGDIVMKREMVNKNRKGGKLDNTISDQMYVVKNFMKNGNIVLQNMDTKELEKKSVPRDQLKKFDIDEEMKSNMTTTLMTEAIDDMTTVKTTGMSQTIDAEMTSNPITNTKTTPMTQTINNMTTVKTTGMSQKIDAEMTSTPNTNMKNDTITNTQGNTMKTPTATMPWTIQY